MLSVSHGYAATVAWPASGLSASAPVLANHCDPHFYRASGRGA